jgi:hypothetical protein
LFTDYVAEPETRYMFGMWLHRLVYFNIAVNLVVLGSEIATKTAH